MRRVLITGGAGFIGCNFVRYLLREDPDVHIVTLDALTYAGNLANLAALPDPSRHTFTKGDICDEALVVGILREHQIDTIVNFAAETHVDRSIFETAPFLRTNVMGVFSLLEAARTVWVDAKGWGREQCRFHHISSDEVYGSLGPHDPAFREDTPYAPNSPYAASKAAGDHLVRAYARTHGIPVTLTNCSNNYGPYQFPEKLIPLVILNGVKGDPIPIYGDGQHVRDWLHVEDHVEAVVNVIRRAKVGESFNVGGGVQETNLQVVQRVCLLLDESLPNSEFVPHENLIQFVADRPGHDRRYAMNSSKIEGELGWHPEKSFEAGLAETIRWYLANMDWVENILTRDDYKEWLARNYARRAEVE